MTIRQGNRRSNSVDRFSEVPQAEIQRSTFNRSHKHMTTLDGGYLVPVFVDEVLPGDTLKLNTSMFARMNTPFVPVMDSAHITVHYFSVPLRLLWDNFKRFMGERDNPTDSVDYLIPQLQIDNDVTAQSLHDYLGIPIDYTGPVNAWFHRAYYLIWNEWYRDQNLQNSLVVPLDDGPDDDGDYVLQRRNKRHDYFTSAATQPQKGDPIDLPIGSSAPVVTNNLSPKIVDSGSTSTSMRWTSTEGVTGGTALVNNSLLTWGDETGMVADLSSASAATINSIRTAFALQKMLERDMRGGTRYIELVLSHFNVTSPDARQQRPEYLGGGRVPVGMNPIAATDGFATGLGELGAAGTAAGDGIGFKRSFTEHCVVIGLASVTADLTYQQGLNRMFSRRTKYDMYWPALAHLGEQEILNKEIFFSGGPADDDVFGYQERYAEYRHYPSRISGVFRSTHPTPLDVWHYSQEFASLPTLSSSFIEENPPFARNCKTPGEPIFKLDCYFEYICERPMPVYGVPGFIDRF